MSYSGSGAVATLWSPSNYNGATKIPVPSTTRRYSTTSSTSTYRSGGGQERSYYSSTTTTNSYGSSSRNVQTEYRSRYSTPIRSSASVPTSYTSRLAELHETTSRIGNKERTDANDSLLNYRRSSKTENDVAATLEKYGLKTDAYRMRSDSTSSSRFLNPSNIDSRYSSASRKTTSGNSSLELSRLTNSSKPPKSTLNSRLQRKESLTKSESTDTSLSLERKISSAMGGSSSPIEIRKPEVWENKLSVSYGENASFHDDSIRKVVLDDQVHLRLGAREDDEDENDAVFLENAASEEEEEEKTLTFEEIRKKFDTNDLTKSKGGLENSLKSSQDECRASISNGVILGVHNFGQIHYLDRNSKVKKVGDLGDERDVEPGETNKFEAESNNSFSSPQTLRRTVLKPIPVTIKSSNSNSILRKSPADSNGEVVAVAVGNSGSKKKSSPDLKKGSSSSPEKKEGGFSNLMKLPGIPAAGTEPEATGGERKLNAVEAKREARNASINAKLGLETRADAKFQPKVKGEKLSTKIEQTLSKQPDVDIEVMNVLSRMRKNPEGTKLKDLENQTKVIELRRIDASAKSPFEPENKKGREEIKERPREGKSESPSRKPVDTSTVEKLSKPAEKVPANVHGKEMPKSVAVKEQDQSSGKSSLKETIPVGLKSKETSSPKEEKDSQNAKERESNKKSLTEELAKDVKCMRKEDRDNLSVTKDLPTWEKQDFSAKMTNRTFPGQASTSHSSNSHSYNKKLENSSLTGSSPRSSLGRSRIYGGEKGGLNGLKNIGNTCFMNSVLQCLSNTKPLLEYLLNEDYLTDINFTISAMKGSLIKAFSNVIQELWAPNTEDRVINTTNFKSQIQKFAPRFMGYAQQDAQEFLRYLLEGLHEDVNRVTVKPQQILTDIDKSLSDNQKATEAWKRYVRMDDSKVVDIFVGQLKSTLQCTVCGHCSVTFDPFWDLSLPLPSRSGQPRLTNCLDAFTKEEVLDGEEKPTCAKCETRRKCTKSFSIQKFPKILVLHLKRFSSTERYRGKLMVTVDFPLTNLDLSPYAANKSQGCTYNLYAISNHSGTAYGGHYTAYCKHPHTGNWHEYNDSRVSSLSSRSVVSGEAYVLFYELATQTSHL